MANEDLLAHGVVCQIGILRELSDQVFIQTGHNSVAQGDTIQQACDALGDRAITATTTLYIRVMTFM